jgi:hypothetical protein
MRWLGILTRIGCRKGARLAPAHLDKGFVELGGKEDAEALIVACRNLRFWDRPEGA